MPAEYTFFGKPGRPLRKVIPSPNGEYLILVYGEGRPTHSNTVEGAKLFRRGGSSYVELGDLLLPSAQAFVLNDGSFLSIAADYQRIILSHGGLTPDGSIVERKRWEAISGTGLSEPDLALLPPGDEVLVGATDRDDGQGWSEPVYTTRWLRLEPRSGKVLEESGTPMGLQHLLPAPASPCVSKEVGGDLESMRKMIAALPFRREFELRIGARRLLTTSRVIDVMSGRTLLGEPASDLRPRRVFHDLSRCENYAIATGASGGFERWDIDRSTVEQLPFTALHGIRCGVFLASGEIVLGSARGEALLISQTN